MDVNTGAQLIAQVGFPIAACVAIFFLYNRTLKDFTETLAEMKVTLQEVSEFVRTLDKRRTKEEEE